MRVEICRIKKHTNFAFCIILCIALLAYCLGAPFVIHAITNVARYENCIKTIVIDAGHGGADGGVVGKKSGIEEKTLNLIISKYLGEMLRACGYNVAYTRQNDVMHAFDGINNNAKRADMYKRAQIINDVNPDCVVSIHMNYYSMPTRRGAQVFYSKKSEQSACFAKIVQAFLNEQINSKECGREYSALCAQKYILECSDVPSIIVECGFLSNIADEYNLLQPQYQLRLACVICEAISAFLE